MSRKRSAFAVYKEFESEFAVEEEQQTTDVQQPVEKKRRGRKKEVVAEDQPINPPKKRGRRRKKDLCEDGADVVPEPDPLPQEGKESKPRGRGRKKAAPPKTIKVEPATALKIDPDGEQMPPEDSTQLQEHSRRATIKKKSSRRKTYVVTDEVHSDEENPDSHPINVEPTLNSTIVKEPEAIVQRKRSMSNPELNSKASHKGTTSPKKVKKAKMLSSSPSPWQIRQAMEQPMSGVPFLHLFSSISYEDSREAAREMFQMLIHPVSEEHFLSTNWEKKPVYLKRNSRYNEGVFSCVELDRILRENDLQFTVNVDVTSYESGTRKTHNPAGRAHPHVVWGYYNSGCSVRLLNPQTYSRGLWYINSVLQEYFHSCVGSNIYLTPPGTQGFAPHYDDIEAFVLQLEGRKRWRLYKPRSPDEALPLESSPNFTDKDIGEPILDAILQPGDLLYFPRGTIHQAQAMKDEHSLHVTVSTYQRNTWGDYLQKLLTVALSSAHEDDITFREGLPLSYLSYTGMANLDSTDPRRGEFVTKVKALLDRLKQLVSVDQAADEMAADYLHTCLPPCLSNKEAAQCSSGSAPEWDDEGKRLLVASSGIDLSSQVKLVRHGAVRIMSGTDAALLVYTTNNGRVYKERDIQTQSLTFPQAGAVEHLLQVYPSFVSLKELPLDTTREKIQLAQELLSKGLLIIRQRA